MTDFPPTANPASPPTAKALALEDWLVVLIMAALALITFANVLLRYFTDTSFAWTEEISIFLMIVLAMVGGSSAVARDQHIRIEFFSGNGSAQRRRRLARLGALMTALLFTVLAVLSVRLVWDDWRYEETSPGIGVPQWWYSMWLPICSVAIALRALGLFVRQGHPAAFAPEMIEGTEAAENTTAPAQTQKPQADQPCLPACCLLFS